MKSVPKHHKETTVCYLKSQSRNALSCHIPQCHSTAVRLKLSPAQNNPEMRVWTADNVPLPLPRLWSFLSVPVQFQRQQRGRRLCRTLIDSAGPDCDTHRAQSWNYHFIRYIRPKPVWFYDGFHLCTPHLPVLCVSSGSGYLWPGGVRQTTTSNYNGFAMPSACKHYYGTPLLLLSVLVFQLWRD